MIRSDSECPTLGFSCCRKPERGTSGGWRQSAANPCWALVVAQGFAVTSRLPRPTPARQTTPPRLGSPAPRRTRPPWYRGGRDTASAAVAARHPAAAYRQARATRLFPACGRGRRAPPTTRAPGPGRHAPLAVACATRDCAASPRRRLQRRSGPGTLAPATRARGTGTRPTRRAAPTLRHRPVPTWEDGGPALAVGGNPPRGGEPARDGGAPSRVG